jgi:serine/threonine protein phosphatase PrpC
MSFPTGHAQHMGARRSQQDSFGFGDSEDREFTRHAGLLAVVCDGMGGMEHGDEASRTAVRAFLEAYRRKTASETIPDALVRCVHEANRQVLALASSLGLVEGVGTTLVAAVLYDQSLFFVSVGDSGLFHVNSEGMRMLNRPHIFANVLDAAVERGKMSQQDAASHPERESLTSFIGARQLEEIDRNIEPMALDDRDGIVLASDGLFKTLNDEEMRSCCAGPPQTWPELLVQRTLDQKREYQDNVTVLSISIESAGLAAAPPLNPQAPALPPPAAPPGTLVSRSLLPVLLILLLILAAVGWWYIREHERH